MTARSARTRVLLDTDIGDDIDDALALGLILACPELELVGVTTVFGNTVARARQARTILAAAGRPEIPVAAGCGAGMTTRPPEQGGRRAYLEGHLPNQDPSCWPEERLPALDRRHGVDLIVDAIMAGDGDIIPITIGAMTNLAMALVKEPRLAAKIPKIAVMAGEFRAYHIEWNIRCDPEAAAIVTRSGIPIDWTPFYIGEAARFAPEHFARLDASRSPLARQLVASIKAWQQGGTHLPWMFDPMSVATIVRPELCTWRTGLVDVELAGSGTYGCTTFAKDAANAKPGPHRVAWDVERDAALTFFLDRITANGAAAASAR
jgi:purine nucleosidase/pyrimidine-specific ribonucleoside hydrolase